MPEEAAVLDAPLDTGVDASVDTPDTPIDPGATPDENQNLSESGEQTAETPVFDKGRLSEAAKQHLEELKAVNPSLAKALRNALYEADAFKRELPGGIKEYRALKQQMEAIGDPEAINSLRQEASEWEALDQQFTTADPRFIESIAEANQDSFLKLAPVVIDKFRALQPDAYSKHVSSVFVADMLQEGIPLLLERLGDFLPGDNPRAVEILQRLQNYVKRIDGFSKQEIKAPQRQDPSRETEFIERENRLRQQEWGQAINGERVRVFNSEWSKLSQGRTIPEQKAAAIKEIYLGKLEKLAASDKAFKQTIDRYFQNNDMAGYERYMKSTYARLIPAALKFAFDNTMPAKPGPKANGVAAAQNGKPLTQAAKPLAAAGDGFQLIGKSPGTHDIKYGPGGTTGDMIRQGRAILNDGRKVKWVR